MRTLISDTDRPRREACLLESTLGTGCAENAGVMSKHPAEVELCCKSKAGSSSEGVGKNSPARLVDVHLV